MILSGVTPAVQNADMGAGLSLAEQVEMSMKAGIECRVGEEWLGRLEEWLAVVLPPGADERYDDGPEDDLHGDGPRDDETVSEWTSRCRAGVQTWCFPSDELRSAYLDSLTDRSEADVLALLRLFVFEESCFGRDSEYLHEALYVHQDLSHLDRLPTEYARRLLQWIGGSVKPHPSLRWSLDLLPHAPQQAIDAIAGYLAAYSCLLPSGRSQGLLDATSVIRAKWIEDIRAGTEALFRLSPRDLEKVVAALYQKIGYEVQLTPKSRDGGRDVIAARELPGQREIVEIECKAHTSPVGVGIVRQLQGVVAHNGSNRGVLVTIGTFTRGARDAERHDSRLELVDGAVLIRLLNLACGPSWIEDRARICGRWDEGPPGLPSSRDSSHR